MARTFGFAIAPNGGACVVGAHGADDCRRKIQGFVGICEGEKDIPKRRLRWSADQIGLVVHVDGMYGLMMMCAVVEKGESGRMHGVLDHYSGWRTPHSQP